MVVGRRAGRGVSLRFARLRALSQRDFWKVRLAQSLARVSPDGIVVDLGINDTVSPGTATSKGYAAYGAKIDWLMRLLPASEAGVVDEPAVSHRTSNT